jgi:hypothetical protein
MEKSRQHLAKRRYCVADKNPQTGCGSRIDLTALKAKITTKGADVVLNGIVYNKKDKTPFSLPVRTG